MTQGTKKAFLHCVFGVFSIALGIGSILSLLLLLIGFASPLVALKIIGTRRAKAFDRQLPDMLATIASTLIPYLSSSSR